MNTGASALALARTFPIEFDTEIEAHSFLMAAAANRASYAERCNNNSNKFQPLVGATASRLLSSFVCDVHLIV